MQINRCKADFSRVNPSSERRDTPSDAAPLFPQKLSRFFICNLQWIRIPTMGGGNDLSRGFVRQWSGEA